MTTGELSQLYYLRKEVIFDADRLAEVDGWIAKAPRRFTDELLELRGIIADKLQRCTQERDRLQQYIDGIDDSYIQGLFIARFVDGKNWLEISTDFGCYASPDCYKKAVLRYMKRAG